MTAATCGACVKSRNVAPPLKSMRSRLSASGELRAIMPSATVRSSSDLPDPVAPDAEPVWPHAFFGGLFDVQLDRRTVDRGSDRERKADRGDLGCATT